MKQPFKLASQTILATTIVTLALAMPATAKSFKKIVRSGQATEIAYMGSFNTRNCDVGPIPKAEIKVKPQYGTLTIKTMHHPINKGKCAGMDMKVRAVFYTPNRGYRGTDKARIKFSRPQYINHPGSLSRTDDYQLVVR